MSAGDVGPDPRQALQQLVDFHNFTDRPRRPRTGREWLIARLEAGLTQDQLARLAGISAVTVRHLESGGTSQERTRDRVWRALQQARERDP